MKSYCITSNPQCEEVINTYKPDFILYRDKESANYSDSAKQFVECCRLNADDTKVFLHQDYTLAKQLGVDGVHLTSLQFDLIEDAKKMGLEVIVSTHSLQEMQKAQSLGADYVTYSPIFATPNKGEPKGVVHLKEVVEKSTLKVFALGGIVTQEHIDIIRPTGVYGFASIRYFQSN